MTPLVIGLAAVVMVILIVVVIGMRYVRNEERADLADREADGGRTERVPGKTRGKQTPDWRQPGPRRPPGRVPERARQRRASAPGYDGASASGYDERPGRGEDRGYAAADHGQDDRRLDVASRATRGQSGRDEPARPQQRQEDLPQVRARQPRGRRNDDGDWPSTEWDKLSDADYWKEVASDKPLTTTARTAQPAQQPHPAPTAPSADAAGHASQATRAGIEPQRGPDLRRGQETRRGQEPRRDAAQLPGRGALEPAAAGGGHDFLSAPTAVRFPEYGRPEPALPGPGHPEQRRPEQARPQAAPSGPASPGTRPAGQRAAAPMPYDDDPLTSPSFPKIVTSDSRSYGSGRPPVPSGRPAGPAEQAAYGAPTAQFASYGTASYGPVGSGPADGRAANGYDRGFAESSATTAPHSYGRAAQPPAVSYPANGYHPAEYAAAAGSGAPAGGHHPAGYAAAAGSGAPASPQQPASPPAERPLPAVPLPAAPPPAGNPYGSYVSAELPGYADNPTAVYSRGQAAGDYPGYPAGPANGNAGPAYSYDLPLSDSALPLGQAPSWYPEVPAMAPAPAPVAPAPLPHPDRYPDGGISGHDNGNGQRSPSGYAPGPYSDGHYDVPGYPPGGYSARPAASAYPPGGADSARQLDAAGYLPPDFYRGDGYGGQHR